MIVPFNDLVSLNKAHKDSFHYVLSTLIDSGEFISGSYVHKFEQLFSDFHNAKHCIGVGNGGDALELIFDAYIKCGKLTIGDKILVPANTFIASIFSILNLGLVPVLCDPDPLTFNLSIERIKVTFQNNDKVKAILSVNMYGRPCNIPKIREFCDEKNILFFEDCAQSHGASFNDTLVGSISDASAFSFYPGKNLGALGDAGCVLTNNTEIANIINSVKNYGSAEKYVHNYVGRNSRLDNLQAGFLIEKLKFIKDDIEKRNIIANQYYDGIINPLVTLPKREFNILHVYHLFVVLVNKRDKFQEYLKSNGIDTIIHYPIHPSKQLSLKKIDTTDLSVSEKICNTVISLPIYPTMSLASVDFVVDIINKYKE